VLEPVQIAAAIIRFGDQLLMVRQAGPGEEPFWTVPAGRVEPGEFVAEALVREVAEETGISVLERGELAFTVQVDEQREGWFATVWTFEIAAWEGEIAVADPDGFVLEATWVPFVEACTRLELLSWHPLTARYLRGDLERRPLWFRRVHPDGREEWF
jgi:ADP-ribose pyrophosphatase YjhB (NUDIX family)